jgi:hypothetical protein
MLVAMRRLGGFIEIHNYTTTFVAVTLSLISSSAQLESNQLFCLLLLQSRFLSLYVSSLTYSLTHSHLRLGGKVLIPGAHEIRVQVCTAAVCYQDDNHDHRGEKHAYHHRHAFHAV